MKGGWRKILIVGFFYLCAEVFAQESEDFPLPAATDAPRETLETFLESTRSIDESFRSSGAGERDTESLDWEIQRTLDTLDLRGIPDFVKRQRSREAALKLREVLDRVELPPMSSVPGTEDEDIPQVWRIPGTIIEIGRVEADGEEARYLFTSGTINRLNDYYERVREFPYQSNALVGFYDRLRYVPGNPTMRRIVSGLPGWAHATWLELAVWQWMGFIGSLVIGALLLWVLLRLGRLSRHIDPSRHRVGLLFSSLVPLTALLVPLGLKWFVNHGLAIYGLLLEATNLVLNVLLIFIALFAVWGIGFRIVEVLADAASRSSRSMNSLLVRLFGRLVTIFVAVVVLIEGGNSLGIPMTTLLAGAGVGGLALALGAQAAVKNLTGSMMILLDKPYKQGERIIACGFDGVVQDVGIRSTKLQLLTGHEVTVPNETMAQTEVENISRRPYIRKLFLLYLPLDSKGADLSKALQVIRGSLKGHEGEDEAFPPRVFVDDFSRDGIRIKALVWYHPPDYWAFQEWMEKTSLRILEELEKAGVRLIPPARWVEAPDEVRGPAA